MYALESKHRALFKPEAPFEPQPCMYTAKPGSPAFLCQLLRHTAAGLQACIKPVIQSVAKYGIALAPATQVEKGVFTARAIPTGALVGAYCGLVSVQKDESRESAYISKLSAHVENKRYALSVDADVMPKCLEKLMHSTGCSKFMNHACLGANNCKAVEHIVENRGFRIQAILFEAVRDIQPGEELTYYYGPEFLRPSERAWNADGRAAVACRCVACANNITGTGVYLASMDLLDLDAPRPTKPKPRKLIGLKTTRVNRVHGHLLKHQGRIAAAVAALFKKPAVSKTITTKVHTTTEVADAARVLLMLANA